MSHDLQENIFTNKYTDSSCWTLVIKNIINDMIVYKKRFNQLHSYESLKFTSQIYKSVSISYLTWMTVTWTHSLGWEMGISHFTLLCFWG